MPYNMPAGANDDNEADFAGCGRFDEEPSELDKIITYDCGCVGTVRNAEHVDGGLWCEAHAPVRFEGMEAAVLIEALKHYGPSRMGSHTLYAVLLEKLERLTKQPDFRNEAERKAYIAQLMGGLRSLCL